ncbi:MAG: DNA-3-methyladenine glycosylase family protein [Opitutales bacterium]
MLFTAWQIWQDAPAISEAAFEETLDGGQAFRWNKRTDFFEGRWDKQVIRLRWTTGKIEFSAPSSIPAREVLQALGDYFAIQTDFAALTDALPWRSDPVLKTAINAFPGLCILRQPLGEALFNFLCSSTKQIPQIKAIAEAVALASGEQLADGSHALPSWAQLAALGEDRLREAKLGYRARYIHQTALILAERGDYLESVRTAPTEEARELLLQLPGVGRKIADCVLLFGAGRLEAFPIDTWVQKILTQAYGLNNLKAEQLLDFARIHFGPSAGLAQQYLFAAARAKLIAR